MIKLIAGLGNPGRNHEKDRHNVGFWFVSRLAAGERVELKSVARYHGLVGKLARPGGELRLVLPQTYMNLSGKSVGALARFYKILPEEVLAVHDERGVAGHNGLKDIAAQLGTQGFWRLRIGIGHPGDKNLVAEYVLKSPPAAERELIEGALARCLGVSGLLLDGDMQAAMLKLHTQ
jgi:PTH1 family peptidyl-tRNA hydrolase